MSGTAEPAPRVAVVGSGPSGLYVVAALLRGHEGVLIDVIDRLPAPYGLVRYGVAPDHPTIKNVTRVLAKSFSDQRVRFLGNVEVGRQVGHEELVAGYDAVVYATGSQVDRPLGVAGEELRGSVGSAQVVGWYNGLPGAPPVDLTGRDVVVVGGGNVALDVARVLTRSPGELRSTDVPGQVLDAFGASAVTDVHVLVRRGPAQARFTHLELLTLDEMSGVTCVVHDELRAPVHEDLGPGPEAEQLRRNVALFARWQDEGPDASPRRVHFHFHRRAERLVGVGGRVVGVDTVGTHGAAAAPERLAAGLVVRAIGYDTVPLAGLPFDASRGVVPNAEGRVLAGADVVPGVYVAGWCKRGATGVIATNKTCANQTAASVLADLAVAVPRGTGPVASPAGAVDWPGWLLLDEHERRAGAARGAERVKSADLELMLAVASGVAARA
ncbi:FAD-dependent oxidoreductase [Nocardioides humi]|uniref:ferredoxin--NADP(+) reductase n=1 Tax=Nocardioides humi TaxID=449461 RepID=A0ABN2ABA1_9ACTN|nr:FAD-dependent oxidoreductase [Nocardioides humi]